MPRKKQTKTKIKIEKFLTELSKTGDKKEACAESGLPVSTVNELLRIDPEFSTQVTDVLTNVMDRDRAILNSFCYQKMIRLLLGEDKTKSKSTRTKYAGLPYEVDESGEFVPKTPLETIVVEEEKTTACPHWVYDRILGQSDILSAIATLMNCGFYNNDAASQIASLLENTSNEAQRVLSNSIKEQA